MLFLYGKHVNFAVCCPQLARTIARRVHTTAPEASPSAQEACVTPAMPRTTAPPTSDVKVRSRNDGSQAGDRG